MSDCDGAGGGDDDEEEGVGLRNSGTGDVLPFAADLTEVADEGFLRVYNVPIRLGMNIGKEQAILAINLPKAVAACCMACPDDRSASRGHKEGQKRKNIKSTRCKSSSCTIGCGIF